MHEVQSGAEDRAPAEGELMHRLAFIAALAFASSCPSSPAATPSADGMCREHGVVEALCTKHHPALVAVFQAKGDWCSEHGFPESICPQCHPERGGRPAENIDLKPAAEQRVGVAPDEGLKVVLKSDVVARNIGIETSPAIEKVVGPSITSTAHLAYDAGRVGIANARARGVVREVLVDIGTAVNKGQVLARIESAGVSEDRSALASARSMLSTAEAAVTRQQALVDNGIAAVKELQRAQQELVSAQAAVAQAEAAVSVVGGGDAGVWSVTAPLGGVVIERSVGVGQNIEEGAPLFQVVDPSRLWAELDIPEREVGAVHVGQRVELAMDALPGRRFVGDVAWIAPAVDPQTRTVRARVGLRNADGVLRAEMFATARIVLGRDRTTVMVPRRAVQRVGEAAMVFVQLDTRVFEVRRVEVGLDDGDLVEAIGALQAGDVVVTTGGFLLKTETLKGAIGAGCCD